MDEKDVSQIGVGSMLVCDYSPYGIKLLAVERETPTMFVMNNGTKVSRDVLRIVNPENFGPYCMRIPTEDDIMSVRCGLRDF